MHSFLLRCNNWLFSSEPRLRARSSMAMLAVLLMIASAGVMLWVGHAGYASMQAVRWWSMFAVGGLAMMAIWVRSGMTANWSDPAMSLPQILWAVSVCACAYVIVGDAKAVVPGSLAVSLLFAALNLKVQHILMAFTYTLVVFAAAIAFEIQTAPASKLDMEIAYAAALAVMLLGCFFLSLRLYALRQRLHLQRQELQAAAEANRELASRDPLTHLLNRRSMLELLQLEQRRCARSLRTMLLAQIDIDHFKSINDTYGHGVGDLALQTFAKTVRRSIRNSDVLSRWGGEEFVLLLSDTDAQGALLTLERVRLAVQAASIDEGPAELRMTVSIGLATHLPGEAIEVTLDRADQALYRAKRTGRNRVCMETAPQLAPATVVEEANVANA